MLCLITMPSKTTAFLLVSRFWNKVNKTEKCWIWTGANGLSIGQKRNRGNYGLIRMQNKVYYAHRLSWEIHHGEIPPKMQVLHHCDNPQCVRPSHLWLGTNLDNIKDKTAKGRARSTRGEKCHWAKLKENQVMEIRSLHDSGKYTHAKLASMYGVSTPTITLIILRKNWKHI